MYLAFEGIDGSGKGTQANMLAERLRKAGMIVPVWSFPRYGNNVYSEMVADYLNGSWKLAPTEFIAMLYAGDRMLARDSIIREEQSSDVIIFDRYVPSNLAHQAAKKEFSVDKEKFLNWLTTLEYNAHRMPVAEVILLDISTGLAIDRIKEKKQRSYTAKKQDVHEADEAYLRKVRDIYLELARKLGWIGITVGRNTKEEIHEQIVEKLKKNYSPTFYNI